MSISEIIIISDCLAKLQEFQQDPSEKLGIMLTSAPAPILSQLSGVTTGESLISAPPPTSCCHTN